MMLAEHLDASTVAFRVGYESPSQFSREYRRLFGAPPLQDIKSVSTCSDLTHRFGIEATYLQSGNDRQEDHRPKS